jgi:hypothetical protein
MDLRPEIGGRRRGGYIVWPSLQRYRLGELAESVAGGRRAAQRRVARGREPSVATTRRRQEAGVILTESQLHPIDRLGSGPPRCRPVSVVPHWWWRARGRCAAGGRARRINLIAARKRPGSGKIVAPGHGTGYFVTNPTAVEKSNASSKFAMGAPAAFIAISTVRRIRSRWHPPRCCEVVKLCCKSTIPVAKGKVLRTADGPRRLRVTMQRHACRPPPPDLRIPSLWEGGASLWRQLRPYCRLASPA